MNSVPARYTEKERAKHMAAEEERRRILDGQEATYSGSDIRLNPERKLRITRQVSQTLFRLALHELTPRSQMPNGEVRVEDLVGERLIMTYLERRLATVPDDRLGDALSSVAAQEPAVSDLIKKTWVPEFCVLSSSAKSPVCSIRSRLSSVHDRQQKQAKKAEKGSKQQKVRASLMSSYLIQFAHPCSSTETER